MVTSLAIATSGSSCALTVTDTGAPLSDTVLVSTDSVTAGVVSSSVSINSVALTTRPGVEPSITMVSSPSSNLSSVGVIVAVVVPERALAGIVTVAPPLRA